MNLSEGYRKRLSELAGLKENSNLSESALSFPLTKQTYDFLLPIYGPTAAENGFLHGNKLLHRYDPRRKLDTYYFIGTDEEHKEALERTAYMK